MNKEKDIQTYKVVLLGEAGVGKTSIISRYFFNKFDEYVESSATSNFSRKFLTYKEFDNEKICLDIWDTMGEEKFRSLNKIYYKDAIAAVLVYSIIKKKSYEEIINYWFPQLQDQYGKKISK